MKIDVTTKTLTHQAIRIALAGGKYRVDAEAGRIFGPDGELSIKRHGKQDCPTVRLHVAGLPKRAYSVPAHKVVAFAIWGDEAFDPGIHVRHMDANTENNRADNLRLGTPSQNEFDKPQAVRSRSARIARQSQGRIPRNALLTTETAAYIRDELGRHTSPTGRVRRGVVKGLAAQFGVCPSTVSLIGKGRTWNGN